MCRLCALVSSDYFSPMENILALETMKEGHDGSGLGLILRDLGGAFEDLKEYPILSAVTTGADELTPREIHEICSRLIDEFEDEFPVFFLQYVVGLYLAWHQVNLILDEEELPTTLRKEISYHDSWSPSPNACS